ncbi:MAG TPA: TIGR04282 family arsenosugar biosynthesis glycosyltransferase [Pedobacter sp.]|jgi:hypothetical protein
MEASSHALILFVRKPVLGKVKTRLASSIGEEKALEVYKFLLRHTHAITADLTYTKYVYYADEVVDGDLWDSGNFIKRVQTGHDLGERMLNAFKDAFDEGHSHVVIIGSDCHELDTAMISTAFNCLSQHKVVIGPARDGGYYLLGLRELIPQIFYNKNWSTSSVCTDTLADVVTLNLSYTLLPILYDVDEAADLERSKILL